MSGGGIRSAAFNLGVLQALHERCILKHVEVLSAVSGGSYTLSWYLLQLYYAADEAGERFDLERTLDEMFDAAGLHQRYLQSNPRIIEGATSLAFGALMDLLLFQIPRAGASFAATVYNSSGANRQEYREQIQWMFQGVPNPDEPPTPGALYLPRRIRNHHRPSQLEIQDNVAYNVVQPVTYSELAGFLGRHALPSFVFNTAVLVDRGHRDNLWATAFELTGEGLGSDSYGYARWDELADLGVPSGFSESTGETPGDGVKSRALAAVLADLSGRRRRRGRRRWMSWVNLAPAISGAAIGLARKKGAAKTLRSRLGSWAPFLANADLGYLLPRFLSGDSGNLYLSDGGHCENLGAYALIKRGCRTLLIVDAEHEASEPYAFDAYRRLKSRLESKEEERLRLAVDAIDNGAFDPAEPVMEGEITSIQAEPGDARRIKVLYLKLALDRRTLASHPDSVALYAGTNGRFPQDPTSDQIFEPEQFAAYRDLGRHIARGSSAIAALADEEV